MSGALVTGGAGFIGTNLADRLRCEGQRVRVLDNLSLGERAYNMGGGPANAVSLLEAIQRIGELGSETEVEFGRWRRGDRRYYVTDTRRLQRDTGWRPRVSAEAGIERLYWWFRDRSVGGRFARAASAA